MTPIVHFVLGPLSIAASIYYTYRSFKGSKTIAYGTGKCPKCKKLFNIMTGKYKFPNYDSCTHCMREVEVSLKKEN